jgi:serine/threonine-protein kinase
MEPHFVRERRILGRLRHPNIARLIDAGATGDGLPFLVMELVHGEPITTWSKNNKLGINERLQLMLQVCDALQHAHRNLVVHRDLKPGNILVTDNGRVQLLDFGVARLLSGPEDDRQSLTRAGFIHMTPVYAAPEQIGGDAITTATDIFALGAVLYELLTDSQPRKNVSGSAVDMLHTLEQEISPPSKATGLSANWRSRMQGDIDAIVSKATAPDPARRYGSVDELAEDIRRYLSHEPVLARPESASYRAGKFIRRHRIGMAATTAIAIAVGAGITSTAWQASKTAAQARKAEAVKEFVLSLFAGVDPAEALGEELTARQLVDTGATRIQSELVAEPVVRAEILTFLADMYDKMDQDDRAVELIDQALDLNLPESSLEYALALLVRGRILVGRSEDDEGVSSLERALPLLERHAADLDRAEAMDVISIATTRQGDLDRSLQLTRAALDLRIAELGEDHPEVATSYNNLGVLARSKGDYAASRQYHEKALDIRSRVLSEMHPQIGLSLNNLGALEYAEGNFARAADFFERSLALNTQVNGSAHHDTIASLNNYGFMKLRLGKLDEAQQALSAVYQYWVDQDKAEHPNALVTRINLATVQRASGDIDGALLEYQELEQQLARILGAEHPFVAATLHHQARCLLDLGQIDAAAALISRALAIRDKALGVDHPDSAELIRDQGLIALLQGDFQSARVLTMRVLELQRSKLPGTHPSLANSLVQLGRVALAEGDLEEALQLQRDALQQISSLFPPDNIERADAHLEYGRSLLAAENTVDAVMQFNAARNALTSRYGDSSWRVAKVDYLKAAALEIQGRQQDAVTLRQSAMSRMEEQLPQDHPLLQEIRSGKML